MTPESVQNHIADAVKVVGVNTTAFVISLASIETFFRIGAPAFAMLYTGMKMWDWWEERRARRKAKRDDALLPLLALCLLFTACATPKLSRHAVAGTQQVQAATVHVAKAKAAGERAQQSIATGKQAATELKRTATPAQKPHVERLERSLAEAERENQIMRISLSEAEPALAAAQASIDTLGVKLFKAEEDARDYQRLKLWLALFVGFGAAYVAFRMVPAVSGPVRYYAMAGSGLAVGLITYFFIL